MAYLDVDQFRIRTEMPAEDVAMLEQQAPQYLDTQLEEWTSRVNSVLAKRYAVPFADPVPEIVLGWLTRLITPRAYRKRGVNPSDEQYASMVEDAKAAWEEILQAANSETGLYDLPLRQDTTASGIVKGGPFSYSEPSPYTWTDVQAEAVRNG